MNQWMKMRKEIRDYPVTEQQKKVRIAGKVVGIICKGKKGQDFRSCRVDVLACVFDKDTSKCNIEIDSAKHEVEERLEQQ